MKHFYLYVFLFTIAFAAHAQNKGQVKSYNQVPTAYQSHPELGKVTYASASVETDYELLQERTQYSRTFLNTNQTRTTVQSSVPLHYQGDRGMWYSIDYKLQQQGNGIVYPAQQPFFKWDNRATSLMVGKEAVTIDNQQLFRFVSNGTLVKTISGTNRDRQVVGSSQLAFQNIAPGIDKNISLYEQALKYDYRMQNAGILPQQFDYMLVEETITLPRGFSMQQEQESGKPTHRIVVLNEKGEVVMAFQQAVVSDSKVMERNMRQQPYEATYELVKINQNTYSLQLRIEAAWLQSSERVYPITIDPVVTLTDNTAVNSCYTPAYQQSTLQVAVPAGQSVLSTNFIYDYIAVTGSGAWMSDQRSFISGPNGQTPVANGVGNTAGTYTYTITNSAIGNTVSTGQVAFTFNFMRTFGGSGCNATYEFVNRREIAVTYGTITFGNGPLLINEYSASNRNFNDAFGRNEDWIELYNASPTDYVNLAGYYLSNNSGNPTKWQIQAGVVPPNSKVLVFCSNRNIASGTVFHASFDLTQTDQDEVVLADPTGTIIDSQTMFITQTNHSYGRTTDGANTWSVFSTPTPGAANTNGFAGYTTKPTLSVAPGKYPGPISVSISSTGTNEQIRYTTNGATPTATSTLYTGPISIMASTVIRARAFSTLPTILPGFIETNTYFINESSSLPIVSIAGDANLQQLLGGTTLEPTGYFEYFLSNGTFIDETMGDFDRHGNDSWAYNQRGIDFIARDDHGYKRRLEHQFFSTTNRGTFRRLILKAAGSDNYPGQTGGAHFRDVFVQKISELSHLELDERRSTFVSLFVNGQYWGVYDLREKVDDNQYTDYYYGQDYIYRDSDQYIQYIKTWGSTLPEFGNQPAVDAWTALTTFVQNNNMALTANYNYVDSQLNIDSLIDYFVINSYMVNRDWLNWNTSWWRGTNPTGSALKWRYALWDCDGVLGHYINYTGISDTTADAPPCQVENITVGVGHTQTIKKLIDENPIVRQRYITRYADLLNTHLKCDRVTQVFDSIVSVITPEMPRQIARWGGNMATWQANVLAARNFLLSRCSQTINTGLTSCYNVTGPYATTFNVSPANSGKIKMNSEWLATYPYTAQVFGNIQTLLKAEANPNYVFDHWVVAGAVIQPNDLTPDIILQISQGTSVTAYFNPIVVPDQALYYWHFNTLGTGDVTNIPADYSLITGASPMMTYTGTGTVNIDANNTGSDLNLHFSELAGKCARVRNPSDNRALVFDLPTTGYKDIKFAYAVMRTAQGQLANELSYTVDGVNYIQASLAQASFSVGTDFALVQVDFTAITAVNNNSNFKIKLTFTGNTTAANGNNRFDNVTLKGVPVSLSEPSQQATTYQVFPNPFTSDVEIITNTEMTGLAIYDVTGKKVFEQTTINATSDSIDLGALSNGVYLMKIQTTKGGITHKLVKQ